MKNEMRKALLAMVVFAIFCVFVSGGVISVVDVISIGTGKVVEPEGGWTVHVSIIEGLISWTHSVDSEWIAEGYVNWIIYQNGVEYDEGRWHEDLGVSERYSIPEPYYTDTERGIKDIRELKTALKQIKHIQDYEVRVYDCSEMSAYTEYILENKGFNVTILSNGKHAWLAVHDIADRGDVHIECTRRPHPGLKTVTTYTKSYRDIYAACGRSANMSCPSWNWWHLLHTVKEGNQ